MTTTPPLCISATVAARRGLGFVTAQAQDRPVTITSHGRPVTVVMSAAEHAAQGRALRGAERAVLRVAINLVADRSTTISASEARERLLAAD